VNATVLLTEWWPAAALAVVAATAAVAVAAKRAAWSSETAQTILTVTAAGIATSVAVTGMWRVFGDALGIHSVAGKVALSAFLEIALLASAIRARASLRATGSVGVDGAAVWVMAAMSGVFAAWDQDGGLAKAVRMAAPLVAAWLWERGLAADRRATRADRETVAWRFTLRRVAVWLRLADPTHRATSDVDKARRIARLTRARLRVAVLESATGPRWVAAVTARPVRLAVAHTRLTRQALAAVEHLSLGQDGRVERLIGDTVRAVVTLPSATDPATMPPPSQWGTAVTPRQPRQAPATRNQQVTPQDTANGGPLADSDVPLVGTPVAGPMAVLAAEVADMAVVDQVAWFSRQLARHEGRTVAEWSSLTGLARRTVERRISAARQVDSVTGDAGEPGEGVAR
jgi:hypothetical protein